MPALRLFGTPTLTHDDGLTVEGRASQRHRLALLALLTRTPGGCTRDKLVALLWPESSAERARSSLSESVYILRRALGETAILSAGDDVRLAAEALEVDVTSFEQAIARGNPSAAVEIYRGPFMDGFFLTRSGEFERWLEGEREGLASQFRRALETLAVTADREGNLTLAITRWRRLVTEAPLDARLATCLMESLVASGNRAAALEHARIHAALTAQEAGLPPDPRVEALAARIRDGWSPAVAVAVEREPPVSVPAPPISSARTNARARRIGLAAAALVIVLATSALIVRQLRPGEEQPGAAGSAVLAGGAAAMIPPAASVLFERGRGHLVHHREAELHEAIAAFDSAVAIDAGFARAHAGLAIAAAEMNLRFASVEEAPAWGRRAVDEARRALELDSTLAEAHEALAAVHRKSEFDWEGTITESRRALQLDPHASQPWFYMAGALYHLGLLPEAESAVRKGLDAQPSADRTEALRTLGTVALADGRYTEASTLLQDVQRLSDRPVSDTHLATAYFYAGEVNRAERLLEPLLASRSASAATRAAASLASFAASRGQGERARQLLARAERGMVDHHAAYSIGVTYAQLRDAANAVRWLRAAAETGFRCYPWYTRDPLLAPVRGDPAYRALEQGLKVQWEKDRARFGA